MDSDQNKAADALDAFDADPLVKGADEIASAFEAAGESIARSLEGAAKRGQLSFSDMAESVLKDLAKLAVTELVEGPLNALVGGLTKGLGDALGGGKSSTNITMNLSGVTDAQGFRRSEGQIGAHLARAVGSGAGRI